MGARSEVAALRERRVRRGGAVSISAMTNVAVSRRTDDLGTGARGERRTARETAVSTADEPATQSPATAALKSIAAYIPTEIITLYVATLAVLAASEPSTGAPAAEAGRTGGTIANSAGLVAFWIFIVLTPVVVWLVYAAKVRNANKALPKRPKTWPWWEMISASIAFATWAYAMPNSVFTRFEWYTTALGGLAVLIVSTALGLVAPIVQRPLKSR